MNKEKLKKVANMAMNGTTNEKKVAKRILRRLGYKQETQIKELLSEPESIQDTANDNDDPWIDQAIDELEIELRQTVNKAVSELGKSIDGFFTNFFRKG